MLFRNFILFEICEKYSFPSKFSYYDIILIVHLIEFILNQGGEDGIIEQVFNLIGYNTIPFCVDVGAWDGLHLSNTRNLLEPEPFSAEKPKWAGVLIEGNEERAAQLNQLYNSRNDVFTVCSLVDVEGINSLPKILDKLSINSNINLSFYKKKEIIKSFKLLIFPFFKFR